MSTPSSSEVSSLPLNRILVREKTSLHFLQGPVFTHGGSDPANDKYTTSNEPFAHRESLSSLRIAPVFSPPGDLLCLVPERGELTLHNGVNGALLRALPVSDAQMVEFSPSGRFLVTYSLPYRGTASAQPEGNLRLWDTHTGERLASFVQKAFKSGVLQFSAQETLCFRQGSGEIFVYHAARRAFAQSEVLQRIEHRGFTQYKIATQRDASSSGCEGALCDVSVSVAVFNPEAGGKPARVSLYLCTASSAQDTPQVTITGPLRERSIFGANDASLLWNKAGTALLVHSQSDVDSSNASYYGATGLYLVHLQGELSLKVEQSKEGPVHDVQWSPLGDKFIVSAGAMPSHSTLYDLTGTPVYQFGAAHRNTICFAPHGRFVVLAGFGNLAGEMDFYDLVRLKKLGSNTAHCATASQWSPCSRYFLTASLAPRMNVDNHLKVFKYNGHGPVLTENFERAYDCIWQPFPVGVFPDRPPSPLRNRDAVNSSAQAQSAAAATTAPAAAPAPYRPPRSSGSLSNFMREAREKETAVAVGKVKPAGASHAPSVSAAPTGPAKFVPSRQQRTIPGMAPPGAGPAANKGKTQTQTQSSATPAKKTAPSAAPAPAPAPPAATGKAKATPAVVPPAAPTPAEDTAEAREKKAKALQKKLKQVSELKAKQASGQSLDADQLKKVAGEAALLEELAALSVKA